VGAGQNDQLFGGGGKRQAGWMGLGTNKLLGDRVMIASRRVGKRHPGRRVRDDAMLVAVAATGYLARRVGQ